MIFDIDVYRDVFDKHSFDIHECVESKQLGKIKFLVQDIYLKFPKTGHIIKYTTPTLHKIEIRHRHTKL